MYFFLDSLLGLLGNGWLYAIANVLLLGSMIPLACNARGVSFRGGEIFIINGILFAVQGIIGRGKPIFEIITAVLAIIAIIRIAVANRNLQGTIVGTIVSYLFGYFVSWIVMMLVKIGLLMIGFSIIGALSAVAAIFWVADKIFKKK